MPNATQYGDTLLIDSLDGDPGIPLKRMQFARKAAEDDGYDEAWIQRLIMAKPGVLPIDQIESGLSGLIPVCTELQVGLGFLDVLFITPQGNLVLVECKLWRNAESRRAVIGQIMEYASVMSRWTYEELESAIGRTGAGEARRSAGKKSLFDLVSTSSGTDEPLSEIAEPAFVDAVSRTLRRGTFLLLLVGDGIKENVESLTAFLQQHAGLHFTLGLVELAILKMPGSGFLVQPRVLARTTNINRGIVTFEDDQIRVKVDVTTNAAVDAPSRRLTITKEQYLEHLEQTLPGIAPKISMFIDKLADLGVHAEFGASSLIFRWYPENGQSWNFGTISKAGEVWMDNLVLRAREDSLSMLAAQYMEKIAKAVPGATVKYRENMPSTIHLNGRTLKIDSLLAEDSRVEACLQALSELQREISSELLPH